MGRQPDFEKTCERYLLGELSGAQREEFEEAYFTDDALFEEFQAVKDELLDAYARGDLAADQRERFAAHFLASAANRHELEKVQKFIRAVTEVSAKTAATDRTAAFATSPAATHGSAPEKSFGGFFNLRSFAWQFALSAVLLAALAGTWLLVRHLRQSPGDDEVAGRPTPLPMIAPPVNDNQNTAPANNNAVTITNSSPVSVDKSPVNASPAPSELKSTPPPKKPIDRPAQNRPPERAEIPAPSNSDKDTPFDLTLSTVERDSEATASVTLAPVAARDINSQNTLELSPVTERVRLQLIFNNDDYRSYAATVTTLDGANVWQQKNLKLSLKGDGSKSVTLRFASALLRKQDYIVILKGITAKGQTEIIGEYYFRIARGLPPNVTTRDPSEIPGLKRP